MIKEKGVIRDSGSLAVLSADHSALEEYKKQKAAKRKLSTINNEVDNLKQKVETLEAQVSNLTSLLEQILREIDNGKSN